MTLKDLANYLEVTKPKEFEKLMRHDMPIHVGKIAKSHFQDNFNKSGFVNNGLKKWKPAKRLSDPGKSAANNYSTLQSSRKHLFSSIKYIPGDGIVTVRNDVEYAQIHNEGGIININTHPNVTEKMKKFAWAKYYSTLGLKKGDKIPKSIPEDAARWRALALTKKPKLNIHIKVNMPKRQFIGESKELDDKLVNKFKEELIKIWH